MYSLGFYWRSAVMRDAYRTALQILYILILDPLFLLEGFFGHSVNKSQVRLHDSPSSQSPWSLLFRKKKVFHFYRKFLFTALNPAPARAGLWQHPKHLYPRSICSRPHAFQLPCLPAPIRTGCGDTVSVLLTPLIEVCLPFLKYRRG